MKGELALGDLISSSSVHNLCHGHPARWELIVHIHLNGRRALGSDHDSVDEPRRGSRGITVVGFIDLADRSYREWPDRFGQRLRWRDFRGDRL